MYQRDPDVVVGKMKFKKSYIEGNSLIADFDKANPKRKCSKCRMPLDPEEEDPCKYCKSLKESMTEEK